MLLMNFVNQVVVGALGATAIAAVGFSNSLTFIVLMTLSAFGVSASILVARARGAGRRDDLDRTVAVAMMLAGLLTTILVLPVVLWSSELLVATGASATVSAAGADYLRMSALAVIPGVIGAVLSGVLRSLGHARRPMVATIITVLFNTGLGYLLVFGVGPFPELGVVGAGWATLIATTAKLAILAVLTFGAVGGTRLVKPLYPRRWWADWRLLRPIFVLAIPLGITELAWSSGTFLYNVVAQRLGDDALAAAQIANTLETVFIVGSVGLMSAATALIGRSVGQADSAAAVFWVRQVSRAGAWTGIVFGLLFAASSLSLGLLFADVSAEVREMAMVGILINAAFQFVKVRNMILGTGVLPSGNDTKGVIIGDCVGAFVVGLPLAVVLALYTPLGVVGLFVARIAEEIVKSLIFGARVRRLRWDDLAQAERDLSPVRA
jgi:putative MATE family efflux protein